MNSPLKLAPGKIVTWSAALEKNGQAQYFARPGHRKTRKLNKTEKTQDKRENSRKPRKLRTFEKTQENHKKTRKPFS